MCNLEIPKDGQPKLAGWGRKAGSGKLHRGQASDSS